VELHMIGPLQTNKAKVAVELFDAIHTVDRPSLAEKLARLAQARGGLPRVVRAGEHRGRAAEGRVSCPPMADAFIATCRGAGAAAGGLMCIPPEEEDSTPHFARLREMAARNGLAKACRWG
jgi:uncharacterized pyridoxal phosphate-containing UPF0001 family protein